MGAIKITLETLYDILRNEKKKEDLQKLEETFFLDVVGYVIEKKALLESRTNDNDIFASGEKEKLEYETRSIKRILKEIYEKREKKIIDIALNKSHTGSDIIDTSAMLWEEKELYYALLKELDIYRQGILIHLFNALPPNITSSKPSPTTITPQQAEEEESQEEGKKMLPPEPNTRALKAKIRFIHPTPSFIWKDKRIYGPFEIGDETEIYPEVADLLVRKGRAEKVTS